MGRTAAEIRCYLKMKYYFEHGWLNLQILRSWDQICWCFPHWTLPSCRDGNEHLKTERKQYKTSVRTQKLRLSFKLFLIRLLATPYFYYFNHKRRKQTLHFAQFQQYGVIIVTFCVSKLPIHTLLRTGQDFMQANPQPCLCYLCCRWFCIVLLTNAWTFVEIMTPWRQHMLL